MKFLFDENLSPRLVVHVAGEFPESQHVELAGLRGRSDLEIWEHASAHGFVLVSKDSDFRQRSFLLGHPPKVIWLSVGNAGTLAIAARLRDSRGRIEAFVDDSEESFLVLTLAEP